MIHQRKHLLWLIGLLLILGATAVFVAAQSGGDYTLDWWTVDGGGGSSSGGDYALSGTIGQSDAESMSGGDYTLNGGFWHEGVACAAPAAVDTAVVSNEVELSWSSGTYNVYRAINDPYFTATTPYASNVSSSWSDSSSTLNDAGQNAFYVVGATTDCGQRVAEFEYSIQPGS